MKKFPHHQNTFCYSVFLAQMTHFLKVEEKVRVEDPLKLGI